MIRKNFRLLLTVIMCMMAFAQLEASFNLFKLGRRVRASDIVGLNCINADDYARFVFKPKDNKPDKKLLRTPGTLYVYNLDDKLVPIYAKVVGAHLRVDKKGINAWHMAHKRNAFHIHLKKWVTRGNLLQIEEGGSLEMIDHEEPDDDKQENAIATVAGSSVANTPVGATEVKTETKVETKVEAKVETKAEKKAAKKAAKKAKKGK